MCKVHARQSSLTSLNPKKLKSFWLNLSTFSKTKRGERGVREMERRKWRRIGRLKMREGNRSSKSSVNNTLFDRDAIRSSLLAHPCKYVNSMHGYTTLSFVSTAQMLQDLCSHTENPVKCTKINDLKMKIVDNAKERIVFEFFLVWVSVRTYTTHLISLLILRTTLDVIIGLQSAWFSFCFCPRAVRSLKLNGYHRWMRRLKTGNEFWEL